MLLNIAISYLKTLTRVTNLNDINGDIDIIGITNRSDDMRNGYIYIALLGDKFNGIDYLDEIINNNNSIAILIDKKCNYKIQSIHLSSALYEVDNLRIIMPDLAKFIYSVDLSKLYLIGITGTNGKTSVAYMVHHGLKSINIKSSLITTVEIKIDNTTYESFMTTPEICKLYELFAYIQKLGIKFIVMEVSSHALAYDRVKGLIFDIAIYTNLDTDHLDYHGSIENYFLAKLKLFNIAKHSIVNIDDKYARRIIEKSSSNYTGYSLDSIASWKGSLLKSTIKNTQFEVEYYSNMILKYGTLLNKSIPGGKFLVYNTLAALATIDLICSKFNVKDTINKVFHSLIDFKGVEGRFEIHHYNDAFIVIDYAHTPEALSSILSMLKQSCINKLITVFGCGGSRDRSKRHILGSVAINKSDIVIITSDNIRWEDPLSIIANIMFGVYGKTEIGVNKYIYIEPDRVRAIQYGVSILNPGDILLIAGKGHEKYQEIQGKKIYCYDKNTVQNII